MSVIDDYLAQLDASQRMALEHIRSIIKELVPEVEETISYGIPTFKYKQTNLMHFAAFKDHLSLFPGAKAITEFRDQLTAFTVSKGTIQFTLKQPLPDALIKQLVSFRLCTIDHETKK